MSSIPTVTKYRRVDLDVLLTGNQYLVSVCLPNTRYFLHYLCTCTEIAGEKVLRAGYFPISQETLTVWNETAILSIQWIPTTREEFIETFSEHDKEKV
jgi:hypothetical protein